MTQPIQRDDHDLGHIQAVLDRLNLGPAPVAEPQCHKARKRVIAFSCKLGAGRSGDCSPYTNPGLLRGGGGPNLTDAGRAALAGAR